MTYAFLGLGVINVAAALTMWRVIKLRRRHGLPVGEGWIVLGMAIFGVLWCLAMAAVCV